MSAMPKPLTEGKLVLLVDDVPDNLRLLSDALDAAGYTVLVATDGISALERLDYVTPDIVLLDAVMPGMDGFETCRRLKAHWGAGHVPVVFMTGLTEPEDVVRGFQAGGSDYVTKPVDPDAVLARIEAHLRSARMMSSAIDTLDAVAHAVVVLDAEGRPLWETRRARQWLRTYFEAHAARGGIGERPAGTGAVDEPARNRWSPQADLSSAEGSSERRPTQAATALPSPLMRWVAEWLTAVARNVPLTPRVVEGPGRLVIRLAQAQRPGEFILLLEEEADALRAAQALAGQYRLTPRETDVLLWVARGKTNRDVSDILGMSPRTVNKHLEHVFVKLGVETRAAATALTLRALGAASPSDLASSP